MNSLYKCSHSFYFESFHISEQLNQNSFRLIDRPTEDDSEHFIGDRSQMVVVVAGGICKCSSFVSVSLYDQRYNLCPVVYSVPAQAIFTLAQSNSRIQKTWELRLLVRSDPSYCIRLFTLSGSIANIFCFAII